MSYHYDWLKRQIEIIAAMLAYILAQKKSLSYPRRAEGAVLIPREHKLGVEAAMEIVILCLSLFILEVRLVAIALNDFFNTVFSHIVDDSARRVGYDAIL